MNNVKYQEIFIPFHTRLAWKSTLNTVALSENPIDHVEDLKIAASEIFDQTINESLNTFKKSGRIILLRGCPIDGDLPPTPYNGYLSPKFTPIACLTQLSIFSALDINPIVYEGENNKKLFRQVVPAIAAINNKSSHGSRFEFGYHVDNPDLPLTNESINLLSTCPEYLSLYGLRCDLNVSTRLIILDHIIAQCSPDLLDTLKMPIFKVKRPESFGTSRLSENLPLIGYSLDKQEYYSRFDYENLFPVNGEADRALSEFKKIIEKSNFLKINLLPGDFLIIKNQQTIHARDSFTPRMDKTDRWLMRLFGVDNLDRVVLVENSSYRAAA